jgi:hypothetical protein
MAGECPERAARLSPQEIGIIDVAGVGASVRGAAVPACEQFENSRTTVTVIARLGEQLASRSSTLKNWER